MSVKENCPICQAAATTFLRRGNVPAHQNQVMADEQSARSVVRGDLEMKFCPDCGFVFNAAFDLANLSYNEDYDNVQTCSGVFRDYVDDLARQIIEDKGIRNCRIVEVGCGQGEFLHKLVQYPDSGNTGYGFDPAYAGPESALDGRLHFQRRYYDGDCADIAADAVVCRHVIEHVPDPVGLLRTVRQALAQSPGARVFFETPSVEWILRREVIWDFFYEHCSYWTPESLSTAFQTAGFHVENVQLVFGEQYLWLEATPATENAETTVVKNAGEIPRLAENLAKCELQVLAGWREQVDELRQRGQVALWGAGAKGVTLANLLDSERERFACVVDLNPHKQGGAIPGTGHPIVAPQELKNRHIKTAILMNPNYRQENLALLDELNLNIDLVELKGDTNELENDV